MLPALITLAMVSNIGYWSQRPLITDVFRQSPNFDENMIKQLLIRHDMNHLFLKDVYDLIQELETEFPEVVKVNKIGESWEKRDILEMTVDYLPK